MRSQRSVGTAPTSGAAGLVNDSPTVTRAACGATTGVGIGARAGKGRAVTAGGDPVGVAAMTVGGADWGAAGGATAALFGACAASAAATVLGAGAVADSLSGGADGVEGVDGGAAAAGIVVLGMTTTGASEPVAQPVRSAAVKDPRASLIEDQPAGLKKLALCVMEVGRGRSSVARIVHRPCRALSKIGRPSRKTCRNSATGR